MGVWASSRGRVPSPPQKAHSSAPYLGVWASFLGKTQYYTVKHAQEEISQRFFTQGNLAELELEDCTSRIHQAIALIHSSKEQVQQQLFPPVASALSGVADLPLPDGFTSAMISQEIFAFDTARCQSVLYVPEFLYNQAKIRFEAGFSLGFVKMEGQLQEEQVEKAIVSMESQLEHLRNLTKIFEQISQQVEAQVEIYRQLQQRLTDCVNLMLFKAGGQGKLYARSLPRAMERELEGILLASFYLKESLLACYSLTEENGKEVSYLVRSMWKKMEHLVS